MPDRPRLLAAGPPGPSIAPLPDTTRRLRLVFASPYDDLGSPTEGATTYAVRLAYNRVSAARVKALSNDLPARDVDVAFRFADGYVPTGALLDPPVVATDEDGIATVPLQSLHRVAAPFRVEARLEAHPDVPPLAFAFDRLDPLVLLAVGFTGTSIDLPGRDRGEVRLFLQDETGSPRCADLAPGSLPAATASSARFPIDATAEFGNVAGLGPTEERPFTVVGLAYEAGGGLTAWACDDSRVRLCPEATGFIELDLQNLPAGVPIPGSGPAH